MSDDKKLKQLLASAQQELNRLTTAQRYQSRKEKTHRKIVLGGEVAKYLGLDIEQDVLVGFLIKCRNCSDDDVEKMRALGSRARYHESIRQIQDKENKRKSAKLNREK